jgi:translation initiation factor 1A
MAKNKGAGGNKRRRGKRSVEDPEASETIFKQDGTEYGFIEKTLGGGRFTVLCESGQSKLGVLRGNLKKKVWISNGDIILYGLRDFQDSKVDILHKYNYVDVQKLYRYGELSNRIYNMYTSSDMTVEQEEESDVHFLQQEVNDEELEAEFGEMINDWKKVDNQTKSSPNKDVSSSGA